MSQPIRFQQSFWKDGDRWTNRPIPLGRLVDSLVFDCVEVQPKPTDDDLRQRLLDKGFVEIWEGKAMWIQGIVTVDLTDYINDGIWYVRAPTGGNHLCPSLEKAVNLALAIKEATE